MHGFKHRLMAVTLLVAALAAYVDLPRLYQVNVIGDTLNAARVFDAIQHARMSQLADAGLSPTGLDEGRESLALVLQVCPLQAMAAPLLTLPVAPTLDDTNTAGESEYQPLTGLAGALFKLEFPPPRLEELWQPPRMQAPFVPGLTHQARGPPIQ